MLFPHGIHVYVISDFHGFSRHAWPRADECISACRIRVHRVRVSAGCHLRASAQTCVCVFARDLPRESPSLSYLFVSCSYSSRILLHLEKKIPSKRRNKMGACHCNLNALGSFSASAYVLNTFPGFLRLRFTRFSQYKHELGMILVQCLRPLVCVAWPLDVFVYVMLLSHCGRHLTGPFLF